MWKCHKCGKPVFFAERKQSLGFDWHPECLRCEECGKRLNPGQHAEHKGVPYCHIPCYGALFGPQLFGHGTRVESHTSFGKVENKPPSVNHVPRSHLESKLKVYNQFYDGKSGELKCREVNKRLVLEGVLHIYWGVSNQIRLKEDDDQRTLAVIRKRNSYRQAISNGLSSDSPPEPSGRCLTLPSHLDWDDLSHFLQGRQASPEDEEEEEREEGEGDGEDDESGVGKRHKSQFWVREPIRADPEMENCPPDLGTLPPLSPTSNNHSHHGLSASIRRRPGHRRMHRSKLRRRCSINGHFYDRETSVFTPPYGSHMSVWVTSLVGAQDVVALLLDKYKVESRADDFALFVVRENGERRRLREEEYPLVARVMLGPHEEVARIFLMDSSSTGEISSQVAQFINLALPECRAILQKYQEEEEREVQRIRCKFREMRRRIKQRMEELKVRL